MGPGLRSAFLKRLSLVALLAAASMAVAAGAGAATGGAGLVPAVTAGSRYLALGDSVTFGYEESRRTTCIPTTTTSQLHRVSGDPRR